ncbi:hypothetical protein VTN31DRAFT_5412 [Thermomyces dupontii]|uniref:uncharacterized protein n=1 Tax=Talaromyces thermophilus TaxID=28565 RepID=UPI003743F999
MSTLQVDDSQSRGRSRPPSGRNRERPQSSDRRRLSPPSDISDRVRKEYYSPSAKDDEKRNGAHRGFASEDKHGNKYQLKENIYRLIKPGRSAVPSEDSDSSDTDSIISGLAYGDTSAIEYEAKRRASKLQDPRSSHSSVDKSDGKSSASYQLYDSDSEPPGSHPSYARPERFSYAQPAEHCPYAQPSPTSIPGAFPGSTSVQPSNSQTPTQSPQQMYSDLPQWKYADPDPASIKYASKSSNAPYRQTTANPSVKPYTASAEPQFEIAPGKRTRSLSQTADPSAKGSSQGDRPPASSLPYTASAEPQFEIAPGKRPLNLSVSIDLSGKEPSPGDRPPASPLLEAYKGTYQSISPMPSPIASPEIVPKDGDISDIEPLDGFDSVQHRKHGRHLSVDDRSSKNSRDRSRSRSRDRRSKSRDRRGHERHGSEDEKKMLVIVPSGRKKVTFYDPTDDAITFKETLSKFGSIDPQPLIRILPHLTSDDILLLRAEYKKHAKIHGKGINLAKHIKLKLGTGPLGKACYATALGRWESEAYWANLYYQSGASRRELLIESLIGRTNSEIREIKNCFRDKRYSDDLEKCMKAELKADKFRTAILLALEERRQPEKTVDPYLVQRDVDDLYRALVSREGGETAMIHIILLRSDSHLREILRVYERQYKHNFARAMIAKSRNLVGETLAHILNGAINRPMRDALLLHQAIRESKSTRERSELLISRLVRLHWEPKHLELVKREYRKRYGERLEETIAEEIMASSGGSDWGEFCIELARSSSKLSRLV